MTLVEFSRVSNYVRPLFECRVSLRQNSKECPRRRGQSEDVSESCRQTSRTSLLNKQRLQRCYDDNAVRRSSLCFCKGGQLEMLRLFLIIIIIISRKLLYQAKCVYTKKFLTKKSLFI